MKMRRLSRAGRDEVAVQINDGPATGRIPSSRSLRELHAARPEGRKHRYFSRCPPSWNHRPPMAMMSQQHVRAARIQHSCRGCDVTFFPGAAEEGGATDEVRKDSCRSSGFFLLANRSSSRIRSGAAVESSILRSECPHQRRLGRWPGVRTEFKVASGKEVRYRGLPMKTFS